MSKKRRKKQIQQLPEGVWPAELVESQVTREPNGTRRWFLLYKSHGATAINHFTLELADHRFPIEATAEVLGLKHDGDAVAHLLKNPAAARELVGWTGYVEIEERYGRLMTFARREEDV